MKKAYIFGLCAALMGCAAQNYAPDKIHLQTTNYLKYIDVTDTQKGPNDNLQINISGETYEDTNLYYRVVWFDENNIKIDSLLSKSVNAAVRRDSPFNWSVIAPSADAKSYQVYISDRVIEQ